MANFSHLKKFDVVGATADYPIYEIEGEPTLTLAHAGQSNAPYFNAVLKLTSKQVRSRRKNVDVALVRQGLEQDKELFPKYIIKGWKNVLDTDGNEVPFSEDNARDFIEALPEWLFNEIRSFASDASNFMEAVEDAEETAKN